MHIDKTGQKIITVDGLEEVLDRAERERWTALAIIGRLDHACEWVPPEQTYYLRGRLSTKIGRVASLHRLRSLDLAFCGVTAEDARLLPNLEELTSLCLCCNDIGEEGARALRPLTGLQHLDLSGNSIGHRGVWAIARMTEMRTLALSGDGIDLLTVGSIASLPALTSLDLRSREINDSAARELAAAGDLVRLSLMASIGDEGVRAIASLKKLEHLDLASTQSVGLDGVRAIALMESLSSLGLSHHKMGDAAASTLGALTNLRSLNLASNEIAVNGARSLASLSNLEHLNLSYNEIGAAGVAALGTLRNLTSLSLSSNDIGDRGVQPLIGFSSLVHLDLDYTRIGPESARLLSTLTNLTHLSVAANQLQAEGALALTPLFRLEALNLSRNQIGDRGVEDLPGMTALRTLDVSNNGIGARGARAVGRIFGLIELDLSINPIGDKGASALAGLTGLRSLNLDDCMISDEGACVVGTLRNLTTLVLSRNQVADLGAQALVTLAKLESLSLSRNKISKDGAIALASVQGLYSLSIESNLWFLSERATLEVLEALAAVESNVALTWLWIDSLPAELEEEIGDRKHDAGPILAAYRRYRARQRAPAANAATRAEAANASEDLDPRSRDRKFHTSDGDTERGPAASAQTRRPHAVLFLSANPVDKHPLALADEERAIREELRRADARDCFVLHTRGAAQPIDLLRTLRELRPSIVHFSGHGRQEGVFFKGQDGQAKLVSGDALGQAFAAAGERVRLVVLNACYSGDQAESLRAYVDCVVGMTGAIEDASALNFAVGFYGGLEGRASVQAAFRQGCAAITLESLPDEDRPRLVTRDGGDADALIFASGPRGRNRRRR